MNPWSNLSSSDDHISHCPRVTILALDFNLDIFTKSKCGDKLLGFVSECLSLLGGINSIEPDFLSSTTMHDADGVAIRDADNTARKILCMHVGTKHQEVKDSQRRADKIE